jgi:hypothetical protein
MHAVFKSRIDNIHAREARRHGDDDIVDEDGAGHSSVMGKAGNVHRHGRSGNR